MRSECVSKSTARFASQCWLWEKWVKIFLHWPLRLSIAWAHSDLRQTLFANLLNCTWKMKQVSSSSYCGSCESSETIDGYMTKRGVLIFLTQNRLEIKKLNIDVARQTWQAYSGTFIEGFVAVSVCDEARHFAWGLRPNSSDTVMLWSWSESKKEMSQFAKELLSGNWIPGQIWEIWWYEKLLRRGNMCSAVNNLGARFVLNMNAFCHRSLNAFNGRCFGRRRFELDVPT